MHIRHGTATNDRPRLLITGASTRAAAWSAIRAGFFPVCADRFADEDLRQVAEVHSADELRAMCASGELQRRVRARMSVADTDSFPVDAWIAAYLHSKDSDRRTYIPALTRKEPQHWQLKLPIILKENGLPCLNVCRDPIPPPDGSWIQKPFSGGGGQGVRLWDVNAARHPSPYDSYFQEYRDGNPMSAIFAVNYAHRSKAELIGLTEQLIGDKVAAAPSRFSYCGNIAGTTLPAGAIQTLYQIGQVLTLTQNYYGLIGIDFIWDGVTPWVVEVNPRYTAACELFEFTLGRALLRDHWQLKWPERALPDFTEAPRARPDVIGKLILYARTAVTAPDLSRFLKPRSPWTVPFLADIPRKGTAFAPGDPMCTVFATARTADECRRKLERRADRVRRWFRDLPNPAAESS